MQGEFINDNSLRSDRFTTTCWTMVVTAGQEDSPAARRAMESRIGLPCISTCTDAGKSELFEQRITIPILLQGGEYDFIFPVESSQKPYLGLFATPAKDKHHKTYSMGHSCWFKNVVSKDELEFLDRYLGPGQ